MTTRLLQILGLIALLIVGAGYAFADNDQTDQRGCVDDASLPAGGSSAMVSPQNHLLHRKRIAVVNFEVPSVMRHGWGRDGDAAGARMSGLLTDMFTTALANTGAFDVIERAQLDKVLNEQRLDREALLDPATAPRLGKILGVDMILGGRLTEFGMKQDRGGGLGVVTGFFGLRMEKSTARAVIDARLIDTSSAKILLTETGVGENSEQSLRFAGSDFHHLLLSASIGSKEWTGSRIGRATRDAVNQIAARLSANYPIEAIVATVLPDGCAVLNIGRFAGVKVGDFFDLAQTSQVCDPATGEVIYEDHKSLGTLQVIEVQDNGCKATMLGDPGGRGIHQNDVAILRKAPEKRKHL